jgi:hypothetical protein
MQAFRASSITSAANGGASQPEMIQQMVALSFLEVQGKSSNVSRPCGFLILVHPIT